MVQSSGFEVGAIVKLKSGGPEMTVQTPEHNGFQAAQWFAGKKLERGNFSIASLIEVKPEVKSE